MQQNIARESYFAKEKNLRCRSVLSHVAEVPFCSVAVCSNAWLSWTRPRLVNKNAKQTTSYDRDLYASQDPAFACVGSTTILQLLWLGLSDDQRTINVSQLAVFISSFSFFYDIVMEKEELLAKLLKCCKYGQELFTFANAIDACPVVRVQLPTHADIDNCFNLLSICCCPLTWVHVSQFVKRISTPLFSADYFQMLKRFAGILVRKRMVFW